MLRFLKLFWYLSGSFLFVSLLVNFDFSPEPAPKRGYVVCFQNVAAIQIQLISFKTSISLHLFSLNLSLAHLSLLSPVSPSRAQSLFPRTSPWISLPRCFFLSCLPFPSVFRRRLTSGNRRRSPPASLFLPSFPELLLGTGIHICIVRIYLCARDCGCVYNQCVYVYSCVITLGVCIFCVSLWLFVRVCVCGCKSCVCVYSASWVCGAVLAEWRLHGYVDYSGGLSLETDFRYAFNCYFDCWYIWLVIGFS